MDKHQGEDISFQLSFKQGESPNLNGFDDFREIIVYFYTNGCVCARFSTTTKSGYKKLTRVDSKTLSGNIDNETTKSLSPGALYVEIKAVTPTSINLIERRSTGIVIKRTLIKSEYE